MYPTRRLIFLVLLGLPLSLLGAMLWPALWLAGVVWILFSGGLFLLDALAAAGTARLSCTLAAPNAIGVARPEPAHLTFTFDGAAPRAIEWAIETGPRLSIIPERATSPMVSDTVDADIRITGLRRGSETISHVWIRWHGPLGLGWRQRTVAVNHAMAILPDIATVKETATRLFAAGMGMTGERIQRRPGDGAEFNALREFQSGMDRRSIDWKQSARHGKLLIRDYEAEENLHIIFAVDTGRLMCEPLAGLPRIDRAIHAMLLLAFLSLRLGDRVGLFAFDETPVLFSGTVGGVKAFSSLQYLAARLDYSARETNFTLGFTRLAVELQRRSIVVVFTDFFDTTSAELMIESIGRLLQRHRVLFVTFRDDELETLARGAPLSPADISRAVLADAMLRERSIVTARLKRMGVDVIDVPLDSIGLKLMDSYLAMKTRRTRRASVERA